MLMISVSGYGNVNIVMLCYSYQCRIMLMLSVPFYVNVIIDVLC